MSKQQGSLDLNTLRGSIAVVTGAGNNGIGWGICKHAAEHLGMHVVALDLHKNLVDQAQHKLAQAFPQIKSLGVVGDVTDPASLQAGLATIQQSLPGLRIGAVFANAGVVFTHTILKSTSDEWSTTLNVNVLGVVNTIKTFVPVLLQSDQQSIMCTTASVGGLVRGDGGGASYQASKHAVVALTESLSFELALRAPQIRVHVLCPCIVATALPQTSRTNAEVATGDLAPAQVEPGEPANSGLAMNTENHARQVWDHIEAGNFYAITENKRPYVDHDTPFNARGIIRERMENMLNLTLDNADAWDGGPSGPPSAILKGPMFQEIKRRKATTMQSKG